MCSSCGMSVMMCLKQLSAMDLAGLGAAVFALFLSGVLLGMKLRRPGRRGGSGGAGGGENRPVRSPDLYIGNLADGVSGEELQRQFGKYGDVKEVRMVPPRGGESKTFAFITMASVEAAQAALNGMNGKELGGRKLVVSEARSRHGGNRRRR